MAFFFSVISNVSAQNNGHKKGTESGLFYFYTTDSIFVGVKDHSGKIVIPAIHKAFIDYDVTQPIGGAVIEFFETGAEALSKDSPAIPMGEVYSREGKFLYYPQFYDNGPDYYAEGLRRYVDSNKIGFADQYGNKVIAAKWSFAEPFNYGYSVVYAGKWKRDYRNGSEHWTIVPDSEDARICVINRNGETIVPLEKQQNAKDYYSDGWYYPYPFSYTDREQKIVDQLDSLEVLNHICQLTFSDRTNLPRLQFEITERPIQLFPYYVLQGFHNQRMNEDYKFIVSEDGNHIFHSSLFASEKHTSLKKFIISQLEQCIEYTRNHPEAQNRFDAKKYLKEWNNK